MKIFLSIFFASFFFLTGCPRYPIDPSGGADASSEAAPPPDPFGMYNCASWCKRATQLDCLSAKPTEHGATCHEVCVNIATGPVPWNLQCRTLASSCAAADNCEANMGVGPHLQATLDAGDEGGIGDASVDSSIAIPASCVGWCKHAVQLNCTAAKPTLKGANCAEVCTNVQSGPVKWDLKCRVSAKTCAEADACPTSPK